WPRRAYICDGVSVRAAPRSSARYPATCARRTATCARRTATWLVLVAALTGCSSSGTAVTAPSADVAGPVPASTGEPADRAAELVSTMSDVDLVGQVLMPSVNLGDRGASAADLMRTYRLGGVILMGNIEDVGADATPAQVRAFTDTLRAASKD